MPGHRAPSAPTPAPLPKPLQRALWLALCCAVAVLTLATTTRAQMTDVLFDVDGAGGFVGLGGHVRPGQWTPLRVTLANQSAELRRVKVQWLINDEDGDRVVAQRIATLNPMRSGTHVWLYAAPPTATRLGGLTWQVQVIDAETNRAVGEPLSIRPQDQPEAGQFVRFLSPQENAIGIMSSIALGLDDIASGATGHEPTRLITGLNLADLPDRWYGLSAINTLIWTHGDGEGGSPTDPAFQLEQQEALRDWVRRGGHLVILLPAFGELWSGSPLADLMPVESGQMRRVEDFPPISVGTVMSAERAPITMTVFDMPANTTAQVLERDRQGNPVVVAKRFGFGRVTVVGVDLADRNLVRMGLPNGKWTIWHKVFHWTHPAFTQGQVDAQIAAADMVRPEGRHQGATRIGPGWLPGIIDMTGTATPALLLAIIVFIIYWIVAGPGVYGVLRSKGLQRHTWVAFVLVVGVFTGATWAGALLLRKGNVTAAHFSVVDIDGNTGQAHARGWLSLFVPDFGAAEIAIDPQHPDRHNTLASPGVVSELDSGRFPDQQSYTIDAGAPNAAAVPIRATAKRFTYDYAGRLDDKREGLNDTWVGPHGTLSLEAGWPTGELSHGLPDAIHQLLVVYCAGDGRMPWVWRHNDAWAPGSKITIAQPQRAMRLVLPRTLYTKDRDYAGEGYLGSLIVGRTAAAATGQQPLLPGGAGMNRDLMQQIEMLSFFDAMPPPNFRDTNAAFMMGGSSTTYHRLFGRELDITPLTAGKRLILIGYLKGGHLPVPLTVDGKAIADVSDNSWTVIRWVYDFDQQ